MGVCADLVLILEWHSGADENMEELLELEKFAEYFTISYLDGVYSVFIETVNGRRVDADSGLPVESLGVAIQAAMGIARVKIGDVVE